VQLPDITLPVTNAYEGPHKFVTIDERDPQLYSFAPEFPVDRDVIAVDGTSVVLG
jgi:hypothetical protein